MTFKITIRIINQSLQQKIVSKMILDFVSEVNTKGSNSAIQLGNTVQRDTMKVPVSSNHDKNRG